MKWDQVGQVGHGISTALLFYLLSSPIVLVIALYYLSGQEQQI